MKKIAILLALLVCVSGVTAQERAPFYGVMAGTMFGVDDFSRVSGGIQIGTAVSLDNDKGLSLRTLYTKAKWGDLDFAAYRVAPCLTWYAGKKWDFYVVLGGETWQSDDETGGDYFVGFGTSRRVYTGTGDEWAVPFTVDAFVDFTSDDIGPYGNANQITLGVQFSKPVKK